METVSTGENDSVSADEIDGLTVEVSLLTRPELVPGTTAEERKRGVVIGRHGLIVSAFGASGLLLPQVAVEEGLDAASFLAATCEKAGLAPDAWEHSATRVERFAASVFAEIAPRGSVVREMSASIAPSSGPLVR